MGGRFRRGGSGAGWKSRESMHGGSGGGEGAGQGGQSRGHSRPPGLRGRDIGLYYRNLSRQKREENGGVEPMRLGPDVSVPPALLARVDECLHNFGRGDEDSRLSAEFEATFHDLLRVPFDEFIANEKAHLNSSPADSNELVNKRLKSDLLKLEGDELFRQRFEKRQQLPTMKQADRVLQTIHDNQVVLIVGSTGCGKTTQVPQILFDDYIYTDRGSQCQIVCTQPRRISAISVAERVAWERCESLGSSVGYQIGLEHKLPRPQGSILYCTAGILLQKMQSDPLMRSITAVILDEIHERAVETDLLMGLLKKVLPHRPDLKVILMSATVSEREIFEYFDQCHTLHIEGTLFPVKVVYLEDVLQETQYTKFEKQPSRDNFRKHGRHQRDRVSEEQQEYSLMIEPYLRTIRDRYDPAVLQALRCSDSEGCADLQFLEYLIFYICEHKPPGAILVFLPGFDQISKLNRQLEMPTQALGQRFRNKISIYPLHSLMPTVNQTEVFQPAPAGTRKVILSTIIAETSVTIDDVVYVINTGRTKVTAYDPETNLESLKEAWVTKANSAQRKGRAGRVQPGICYNLFTKARETRMAEVPVPQILCSKMESVVLSLKALHISHVEGFLQTLMSPPEAQAVRNAINLLKRIDALDEEGRLTPLGLHVARLPIDPQMAKMILMAALFRCFDPITSAAAGISYRNPFYVPLGQEKKVDAVKRELSRENRSDHLLIDNVIESFREAKLEGMERDFCYKNFLSYNTLNHLLRLKQQFADIMKSASFIESARSGCESSNVNSHNVPLLRAIIAAGLYPNIAHLRKARQIKNRVRAIHSMSTPEDRKVNFHPSSVNGGVGSFDSHYFVYLQKQKSSAVYLMDSTMVFPMALLIFGDGVATGVTPENAHYISVAKTYHFKCDRLTAEVILKLREHLRWLLQKKALYPSPIAENSSEEYLIKAIQMLLSMDEVCDDDDYYLSGDDV